MMQSRRWFAALAAALLGYGLAASPAGAQNRPVGLSGRVVDASGRGITAALVSVATEELSAKAETGGDGDFQFLDLAPGTGVIRISAPGFATLECPFDVYAGHDLIMQIVVERGASAHPEKACVREITIHPQS